MLDLQLASEAQRPSSAPRLGWSVLRRLLPRPNIAPHEEGGHGGDRQPPPPRAAQRLVKVRRVVQHRQHHHERAQSCPSQHSAHVSPLSHVWEDVVGDDADQQCSDATSSQAAPMASRFRVLAFARSTVPLPPHSRHALTPPLVRFVQPDQSQTFGRMPFQVRAAFETSKLSSSETGSRSDRSSFLVMMTSSVSPLRSQLSAPSSLMVVTTRKLA
jgi:hypothetical protein